MTRTIDLHPQDKELKPPTHSSWAAAPGDSLDFAHLRAVNVARCEAAFNRLYDWSPTDWACAVAGEVGEACNLIKKIRRHDSVDPCDVGDELADAVIYIDLLAARLGIDLGAAVRRKFNLVSDRVGSAVRLPSDTD